MAQRLHPHDFYQPQLFYLSGWKGDISKHATISPGAIFDML